MKKLQKAVSLTVVIGTLCSPFMVGGVFAASSSNMVSMTMTKVNFVYDFLALMGQSPDKSGQSTFSDVPTKSWQWGWIHKALELNLVKPDSSALFGAKDHVNGAFAANLAMNYLGVKLPSGTNALAFAEQNQFFAGISPNANMTLADELKFVSQVEKYAINHQQVVPASWNMTQNAAQALTQALSNAASAKYTQISMNMKMKLGMNLTAAGQKDAALGQALSQLTQPIDMIGQFNVQQLNNQKSMYGVLTSGASAGAGVGQTIKVQEYLQASKLYMNQGQGWQLIPVSESLQNLMNSQTGGVNLSLSTFAKLTATPTSTGYQYQGMLSSQGFQNEMNLILRNLPVSSLSAGVNNTQMQSLMQAIMKTMQGNVTIQVAKVNGLEEVTGENIQLSLTIATQDLINSVNATASGQSQAQQFANEVSAITEQENGTVQFSYNQVPVNAPQGLPQ